MSADPDWSPLEAAIILGIVLTVLAMAFSTPALGSEVDQFTRQDRLGHEAAGAIIGLGSYALIDSMPATRDLPKWQKAALALVPVVLAAAGKELLDSQDPRHHDCDFRHDAPATVLGGLVSISIAWRF